VDTLVVENYDWQTTPEGYSWRPNQFWVTGVDNVDSLSVRQRSTGKGALVGGIVGGGLWLGFGWSVCEAMSEYGGCSQWGSVAGFGLAGAIVAGLIGAAIGSAIPGGWRLDYTGGRTTAKIGLDPTVVGVAGRFRVRL
jgi:hypothetical protein